MNYADICPHYYFIEQDKDKTGKSIIFKQSKTTKYIFNCIRQVFFLSIYVDKYFGLIINKIKSVVLSLVNLSFAANVMEQKGTIAEGCTFSLSSQ